MKVEIECICPVRRKHKGDTVTLRPMLSFRDAVAVRNEIGILYLEEPAANLADVMGVLTEAYLRRGIESWTLRDEQGPLPLSRDNIDKVLLTNFDVAEKVADAADDLYRDAVMLPLLRRASNSSLPGQTDGSTSPTMEQSTLIPMPSKQSSTTTTPTDDIVKTSGSPDGGSRSSRKSA